MKKKYTTSQIVLITVFSIATNIFGCLFAEYYNLPLWFDSFGTVFCAYVLGPWCAVITGVGSHIMHGFLNPFTMVYSLTNISTALLTGYLAKKGWMSSLLKTVSLGILVTLACTTVASLLDFLVFDGSTIGNVWGQGVADLFVTWGFPHGLCIIFGQFYVDFLDKIITLCTVYHFIKFYRTIKNHLPRFLKLEGAAKSLLIFLAVFSFYGVQKTAAQSKDYNSYVHLTYNKENGLPGGKANDIASTNDGILWIGTYEGLYRHNGQEFRLMREFDSLRAVRCLYVDDEGRLFVGTNDNGLAIVINEKVMNILTEKEGLPSDKIRCVTRGSDGLYYVGTAEKMAVLSISDGLKIFKTVPQIDGALRISADNKERVALVTVSGELFILNGTDISFKSGSDSPRYTSVSFSPDGLLYAATEAGLLQIFMISETKPGAPYRLTSLQSIQCGNLKHINSIDFHDDVVFICADNGTGYIDNGSFFKIETGLFNNSIDNMTEDYQGNLWFTSSRLGLLKMCGTKFAEIYSSAGFSEAVINSITRFDSNLYFATDEGLTAIDSKTGRPLTNALTKSLENTRIRCLTATKSGDLWICTGSKGLIHATPAGKTTAYGQGHIFRVAIELFDGTIAAGGNDGIAFIRGGKIISWIGEKEGLPNTLILSLSESSGGTVFAGTDGSGLVVLNNETGEWKVTNVIKKDDGLSSNVILRTVNDYDGINATGGLFIVTGNGLCYLEPVFDFSERNSLENIGYKARALSNFPYWNNYDMVVRKNGDIFVLGSAGIIVVNRDELLAEEKMEYEVLDLKKGLRGSFTVNSWNYLDEEGNLYLSCDSGASRINLNRYNKNEHSFRIQLKSILVDGKRHIVQKDSPFVISAASEKVEILPEIINFSINNPCISLYMEGVDEKPEIMLQSELSSLTYTNLKAGTYALHISVLDPKSLTAIEESVYTIKKSFHIYENWWFMFYLVTIFILVIAWLTWFITSTLLKRRMEFQAHQMEEIQKQVRIGNETIFSIANAVEARDKSTGKHSFRVAEYSVLIARELGFSEKELDALHKTGLLHDIGKIGVPDSILNKPEHLSDDEYSVMKTHVNIGGDILKDFSLIENVADGAKYHHERYDGKGYPNGLKGEEIPLNARIIGIADAFDAMTANRVYRKALDMDFVVGELKRLSGTQFDPDLVEIMLELIEKGLIDVSKTVEASANGVHYEQ